jgi:hypothetical protein
MKAFYEDDTVQLHLGDCLDILPTLADASVDAVVTDAPYELGFMGKAWDASGIAYNVDVWRHCWRVLKPGGHLVAFGGTRTYHRMTCAIEDAGFEIRDSLHWIYGCLDEQTEILIDGQWEPFHKAKESGHVLGYDAEHDEFSWQPIQRVVVFPYSDTAYRLVGDHTDQLVTREHRCLVERGGKYVFQEAQEAARERQARVPVLEDLQSLLNALPLPDQGADDSKHHLLEGVREPAGQCGQQRKAEQAGQPAADVPGVREAVPAVADQATRRSESGLLAAVPGRPGRRPAPGDRGVRKGELDGGLDCRSRRQDERSEQSGLERRGHLFPQTRELQGDQVRAVPGGIPGHEPQGRLCDGASPVRSPGDGQAADPAGSRAPRGSQPDQQCAREPVALQDQPGAQTVRGSRFTSADLVRIEPEFYDGIAWCVTVPTGAFVARRNGKVFVTGNSGFPKGQNIGKAIDKRRDDRAQVLQVTAWLATARDAAGWTNAQVDALWGFNGMAGLWTTPGKAAIVPQPEQWDRLRDELGFDDTDIRPLVAELNGRKGELGEAWALREVIGTRNAPTRKSDHLYGDYSGDDRVTLPATDAAKQWHGWNTQLRPAHEPIVLARKSTGFNTTVANVLEHGTGALHVDACRTAAGQDYREKCASVVGIASPRNGDTLGEWTGTREDSAHAAGRWPTNILLCHGPDCIDGGDCQPECPVAGSVKGQRRSGGIMGQAAGSKISNSGHGDTGGASRYFPIFRYEAKAPKVERPRLADGTAHTTVKPLTLMRWLVRLITPPGGTVLDPFAGSGTTLEACRLESFQSIGIEKDPAHAELCKIRLGKPYMTDLFGGAA